MKKVAVQPFLQRPRIQSKNYFWSKKKKGGGGRGDYEELMEEGSNRKP